MQPTYAQAITFDRTQWLPQFWRAVQLATLGTLVSVGFGWLYVQMQWAVCLAWLLLLPAFTVAVGCVLPLVPATWRVLTTARHALTWDANGLTVATWRRHMFIGWADVSQAALYERRDAPSLSTRLKPTTLAETVLATIVLPVHLMLLAVYRRRVIPSPLWQLVVHDTQGRVRILMNLTHEDMLWLRAHVLRPHLHANQLLTVSLSATRLR